MGTMTPHRYPTSVAPGEMPIIVSHNKEPPACMPVATSSGSLQTQTVGSQIFMGSKFTTKLLIPVTQGTLCLRFLSTASSEATADSSEASREISDSCYPPPAILLHGFGASLSSFRIERIMRPLALLLQSRVAFDRPAFGLTSQASYPFTWSRKTAAGAKARSPGPYIVRKYGAGPDQL